VKAYLSGAIEAASQEELSWRDDLKLWLKSTIGHDSIDPVQLSINLLAKENAKDFRSWKFSDLPKFKSIVRKIINQDIGAVLRESDYVICYWTPAVKEGGGTQGELTTAYLNNIPVYLVYTNDLTTLSSWIIGCTSEIFSDFSDFTHVFE